MLLDHGKFKKYIYRFNEKDDETVIQYVDNKSAWDWLKRNIPFLDCPDKDIEEVYYFRWWVFRKHIKETVDGYIITEFHPDVPWAGKHNSIVCPAGHHIHEGRWLSNPRYVEDYARFWFKKGGALRAYSNWLGEAIWQYCTAKGDFNLAVELLDDFVKDFHECERANGHESGLFWSIDDRDGGEVSISGNGLRPTLNSYMYGYARAIAKTAELAGRREIYEEFRQKADTIGELMNEKLWDKNDRHFKVFPLDSKDGEVDNWAFGLVDPNRNVREQLGYIPWYFGIPADGYEDAWKQLTDEDGFYAPYGPTTAERRHPRFMFRHDEHECLWNGPSWPFATSMTLTAMINLLNNYSQNCIDKKDFIELLKTYTKCHKRTKPDGEVVRWLDENIDPFTGDWTSRTILEHWGWKAEKGGRERGKDYNHSTYCDLIVTGLAGLRPREDDILEVNPLLSEEWNYFCLDNIPYHDHFITIQYDRNGTRYDNGRGMRIYLDGELVTVTDSIERINIKLK